MAMREHRDLVLDRLDITAFLQSQGVTLGAKVGTDEYRFLCQFHDDSNPSANVNIKTGLWKCQVCGAGGTAIDWLMKKAGDGPSAYKDAIAELSRFVGIEPPTRNTHPDNVVPITSRTKGKLTEKNVAAWHETGLRADWLQQWFDEKRGYTRETVEKFQLGWDGQRVTLPIRANGVLVNVRRRRDPRDPSQDAVGKVIGLAAGMNEARLWPDTALDNDEVLLVEGEWDAMLMHQYGFTNALTATGGAGTFKNDWIPLFEKKRVTIIYDNDDAGRRGEQGVAAKLSRAASVAIVHIPNLPEKGDITHFFVEQSRSVDELRDLIADAAPYLRAPETTEEADPIPSTLAAASNAKNSGVRLELPVLLSGKATTPYTVPYKYKAQCDMSNKKYCPVCPLAETHGVKEVTLSPADPEVLQLVNVTTNSQQAALKAMSGAVPQCNRPTIEVSESINIEELRLIPELDTAVDGDTEYVTRTGYFLGHGLASNRGYKMTGYSHPHPKTQATVHLLSEAVPAQDNISAFVPTPEVIEALKVFQSPTPAPRMTDIYDDFALTVHRIQDRFDMQVAYDLAWHSVISFYFNGAFVRRGWVECMVMGDSGQGKTEMAMLLLAHYRMGQRVQGEQTSQAGLIGGLEKMGDSWMLSWGQVPLNDKRLLIIDEAQGLASSQIEGMSDVRATGIAEITKIRTERTNARCRLVWLANPISGLTLAQHNQGVLAIKDLFKKPEDIRRLDFAITVASGDVRLDRVNVRHDVVQGEPRYSSDLCRSLVLWAWSRRPDQIAFTGGATDLILAEATRMGQAYHPSIPLVEPSDQRLKLARLSAAIAARTFATPDGERLLVDEAHVSFVVDYLERLYNSSSMSYGEYSEQQRKGEQLSPDERLIVERQVALWDNKEQAVEFFRGSRIFKKSDLQDVVGWEAEKARMELRFLAAHRLIRPTREGFVKTAAFIVLLRQLGVDVVGDDEAEPPVGDF